MPPLDPSPVVSGLLSPAGIARAAELLLAGALVLTVLRLWRGPSLPDRVLALDMLSFVAMGLLAVHVVRTGDAAFLDAAAVLGLTAFLATVALARLVETRPDHAVAPTRSRDDGSPGPSEAAASPPRRPSGPSDLG